MLIGKQSASPLPYQRQAIPCTSVVCLFLHFEYRDDSNQTPSIYILWLFCSTETSIVVPICAHDGYTKNLVIRIARFNTLDTLRIEQPPEKRETDFLCNWRCQVLTPCGHCRIVILSIVVPLSFSFSGDPQTSFSKKNRHRPVEWDWLDKLQRLPRRSRLNQTPWPLPLNSSQEKESVEISILH